MQDNAFNYDKGVLAEILEPIMGKGLIPADLETWKPRRRAIVPSFHKAYLEAMVQMFGRCTQNSLDKFDALLEGQGVSRLGCGELCSLRVGAQTQVPVQERSGWDSAVLHCLAVCGSCKRDSSMKWPDALLEEAGWGAPSRRCAGQCLRLLQGG